MTGTVHTQNPTYSRLTLALLEDSGWYLPNYEMVNLIATSNPKPAFTSSHPPEHQWE
jgi:hypothetical protein